MDPPACTVSAAGSSQTGALAPWMATLTTTSFDISLSLSTARYVYVSVVPAASSAAV